MAVTEEPGSFYPVFLSFSRAGIGKLSSVVDPLVHILGFVGHMKVTAAHESSHRPQAYWLFVDPSPRVSDLPWSSASGQQERVWMII